MIDGVPTRVTAPTVRLMSFRVQDKTSKASAQALSGEEAGEHILHQVAEKSRRSWIERYN